MKIGIGLPNTEPGTPGRLLVDWARRGEERGFTTVATIDRVAYPGYDSFTALAAAAGATNSIELMTNILVAPAYPPALVAKNAASLDQLSGGRFTLGLGVGNRPDDFATTGQAFAGRGRAFDEALKLMHQAWSGEPVAGAQHPICPTPVRGDRVPILIGGMTDAAMKRAATWGQGWTSGGLDPGSASPFADRVRAAWKEAGRVDEPRLVALAYYSLGDEETTEASYRYLRDYYAFLGEYAEAIAGSAHRSVDALQDTVRAFTDIGFTGVNFFPTVNRLDQLDRLADAVF
jgi:alkanesulfonate monooxygenase SsuD/methylene tetrahydromethanopterin reductase-like flavin-dependent oxidoreductase (luciferase family)